MKTTGAPAARAAALSVEARDGARAVKRRARAFAQALLHVDDEQRGMGHVLNEIGRQRLSMLRQQLLI